MAMGQDGDAPRIFGKVNQRGIPLPALLVTTLVGLATFLTSIFGQRVYIFLVAASGLTGFIAWVGIAISHYAFRRAYVAQGEGPQRPGVQG